MKKLIVSMLALVLVLPALPAEAMNLGRHLGPARSNFGISTFGTFGNSGFRGNFRLGTRQRGFRNGSRFTIRRPGFRQGFRGNRFNNFGSRRGFRRGRGFNQFNQFNQFNRRPRLNLSRQQLFNQRYLEERAQSLRNILGTKESTQQLNSDLFGGNLVNPDRRGASGGSFTTPFAMPSVRTGSKISQPTRRSPVSKNQRVPLRRQLKKTDPVRGVISTVPLTSKQKARVNF